MILKIDRIAKRVPTVWIPTRFVESLSAFQILDRISVSAINGGEGGIRTPGARQGTPAFKAGAFDHSATSPDEAVLYCCSTTVEIRNASLLSLALCGTGNDGGASLLALPA